MAMDWDKIEWTYKKLQPQIKKIDPSKATNQIKQTKAALKLAWDDEEKFIKALKGAREAGFKGKKPADFLGDKGFKDAYAALSKSAKTHADIISILQASSDEARALDKLLVKLQGDIKKTITKGDKEQAKFQTAVNTSQAMVKTVAGSIGKLTAPELFYGGQITRVVDKIINKSKNSGPAGDAAKLIETKEREKNVKEARKLSGKVAKLCNDAYGKAEADPKSAEPLLKKAVKLIKKLKAINKPYQVVKKKNADLIKKSKDKAKINKAIADIAHCHDEAVEDHEAVVTEIRKNAA